MGKWSLSRYIMAVLLIAALAVGLGTATAFAETATSSNYKVIDTQFTSGTSSQQQGCSASYCATVSIGDLGDGQSSNGTTTASFGSVTPDEPALEVIIDPGMSDLGTLTTEHTGTKTMVVKIRSYQTDGYRLQITGDPPKYNGRALQTPSTPTSSTTGTEQFGLNLVNNTSPNVGAAPLQVPSGDFSFGEVDSDYNQTNKFMYSSGATVAHSSVATGQTEYTISMIINISNSTPAGHYTSDFSAVVIPMY